jgi:hypothetical protein
MSPFSLELDSTSADYLTGAALALELFTAALSAPDLDADAAPPAAPEMWRVRRRPILIDLFAGDGLPAATTARLSVEPSFPAHHALYRDRGAAASARAVGSKTPVAIDSSRVGRFARGVTAECL